MQPPSPVVEFDLPQAITVPPLILTAGYVCMLVIDYFCFRYEHYLAFSPTGLRTTVILTHLLLPLIFQSPSMPANVFFICVPWFAVSSGVYLMKTHQTFTTWVYALWLEMSLIQEDPPQQSKMEIRQEGLWKVARGAFKWELMRVCLDPLLYTEDVSAFLWLPWLSLESLTQTVLFGTKAYLLLGFADIVFGVEQLLLGIPLMNVFDSPFLAHSPPNFWGRRWNLIVSKKLNRQVFKPSHKGQQKRVERHVSFFSSRNWKGFLAFVISGTFHEIIIMAIMRKMTLENWTFFAIHGLATSLHVNLFRDTRWSNPTGVRRVISILANILFLALTGRLFIGPYIRYEALHSIVSPKAA